MFPCGLPGAFVQARSRHTFPKATLLDKFLFEPAYLPVQEIKQFTVAPVGRDEALGHGWSPLEERDQSDGRDPREGSARKRGLPLLSLWSLWSLFCQAIPGSGLSLCSYSGHTHGTRKMEIP